MLVLREKIIVKAHYRTFNGRLVFEVEGETQKAKAIVKAICELHQIFEGLSSCGCCDSTEIRLNLRTVESNEYYGWLCSKCGAELSLGQHKNGRTLFPKGLAGDEHRGWKRFERSQKPRSAGRYVVTEKVTEKAGSHLRTTVIGGVGSKI